MSDATFARPDLSFFCDLDGLGLVAVGQRIEHDRAVIACRVEADDDRCRRCDCRGVPRDIVVRRLAHAPFGWRPTSLHVMIRRYRLSVLRVRLAAGHHRGGRAMRQADLGRAALSA